MISVEGFSHITFYVSNVSQSVAFYRDILGATVQRETKNHALLFWGPVEISLGEKSDLPPLQERIGFAHVAVSVREDEFFRAVEWLKQNAVPLVGEVSRRGAGWSVNFRDPDGIELELHTIGIKS